MKRLQTMLANIAEYREMGLDVKGLGEIAAVEISRMDLPPNQRYTALRKLREVCGI